MGSYRKDKYGHCWFVGACKPECDGCKYTRRAGGKKYCVYDKNSFICQNPPRGLEDTEEEEEARELSMGSYRKDKYGHCWFVGGCKPECDGCKYTRRAGGKKYCVYDKNSFICQNPPRGLEDTEEEEEVRELSMGSYRKDKYGHCWFVGACKPECD